MPTIKLKSSDNKIIEVDMEVAESIEKIKIMIQDGGMQNNDNVLPLPNISAIVLSKVIAWVNYHKNDLPIEEEQTADYGPPPVNLCAWDENFLQHALLQDTLLEVLSAADFLKIKGLFYACAKTVAAILTLLLSSQD